MSTIFLHVGQCGNQLGQVFWEQVEEWSCTHQKTKTVATKGPKSRFNSSATRSLTTSSTSAQRSQALPLQKSTTAGNAAVSNYLPYSLLDSSLPCVLVDSEPKVIHRCTDLKSGSGILAKRIPNDSLVCDKTGRGNNWAFGYQGRKEVETHSGKSPTVTVSSSGSLSERNSTNGLVQSVRECVRKTVEKCDRFGGVVMFHSIAGGTGSGLGSALLECLREDYPLAFIIAVPITPFRFGESPLQHYNSLLCLSWLQTYSDAVLLFQNDIVLDQARKYLHNDCKTASGSKTLNRETKDAAVSVEDMNKHIAHVLCNTLMPIWNSKERYPSVAGQEPWELIKSLCPDPATKFLSPTHAYFNKPSSTWNQVTSCLLQTGSHSIWKRESMGDIPGSSYFNFVKNRSKAYTSSLALIVRSKPSNTDIFARDANSIERKLRHAYNVVDWNPFPVDFWLSYEPQQCENKLATILANSSTVTEYISMVYNRASLMFKERAYLHWYEKYNCGEEVFRQGFETLENIMDSYMNDFS